MGEAAVERAPGAEVLVRFERQTGSATVRWSECGLIGLAFTLPLGPEDLHH